MVSLYAKSFITFNEVVDMNTLDGLHPDEDGMAIIAEVVIKAISENAM